MAILNTCPLTGIISRHDSIISVETNYLNHILGLSISQLTKISNEANMPRIDNLTETKLLFCAYAKQSKLLLNNRQLLNLDNKVIITHFKLMQSIAVYLEKEPKFYNRIPKYSHYSNIFADNFGHYLELLKKEKELYIEERRTLQKRYKEQETILSELNEIDIAEAKLGMMASKYAAKLKLTEETSNNFSVSKQLAQYITTAIKVSNEVREYFTYLIISPVSKLKNDSEVKEIDLVDVIESIEDWETNLTIKYAMLSFLRKKLSAYNSYEGRKVSKIDISDLDFLLGDIELVESKTVESTARSEAATNTQTNNETNTQVNTQAGTQVSNEVPNSASNSVSNPTNSKEAELFEALTIVEHKPKVAANSNSTSSTNSTSLAASILAKIAAKKKGN